MLSGEGSDLRKSLSEQWPVFASNENSGKVLYTDHGRFRASYCLFTMFIPSKRVLIKFTSFKKLANNGRIN